MWREHRVAVVLPAYREQAQIAATVLQQPSYVDWIIVVDDASDDETSIMAQSTRRAGLLVLRHRSNQGVGAATITGYREALRLGADLIIGSNGDGQMNPDDSEAMLEALTRGFDLVRGDRFARPDQLQSMPITRRMAVPVLSVLTRLATGVSHVGDSQCGYHALSCQALGQIDLDLLWPRYGYPNDLLARAVEAGLCVGEVPVDTIYGQEISGLRPWHALHPVSTRIAAAAWRRLRKVRQRRSLAALPEKT